MEAVKVPCLAAESSWLGFPLVKLHPKLVGKSRGISGSVCSKNCSSSLALLTKRNTCPLEGKPACLSHPEQAMPGLQPAWGTACPAFSRTFPRASRGCLEPWKVWAQQQRDACTHCGALWTKSCSLSWGSSCQDKTTCRVYKQEIPVSEVVFKIILYK